MPDNPVKVLSMFLEVLFILLSGHCEDCMWKKVEGGGRRKKEDYFQILETDIVFRVISLL